MKIRQKPLFLPIILLALFVGQRSHASRVEVIQKGAGWFLLVDGKPFVVRGLSYKPEKVGEDPNTATLRDWMIVDDNKNGLIDSPYDSFVDANRNNEQDANEPAVGDFPLMAEMGANTIRVYHHASDAKEVQEGYGDSAQTRLEYNHPPNKELLRDLYKTYGIRVAMGDYMGAYTIGSGATWAAGTDYRDPLQRQRMRASVRRMVLDFKDEPFLLMYVLGNENNFEWTRTNAYLYPVEYAQFVEELAQLIHSLDPDHPVAVCHGDIGLIQALADHAPSVDIFATNASRGLGFGNLWEQVEKIYNKPVLVTEYRNRNAQFVGDELDEIHQSAIHRACWADIQRNAAGGNGRGNALGGVAHSWLDSWWQDGRPSQHNRGPADVHNEWHGLMSQGTGTQSPFLRQARQPYWLYRYLWTGRTHTEVRQRPDGWVTYVNGEPFVTRAIAYSVDKVGEDPNTATLRNWMIVDDNRNGLIDGPYDSFVDANRNNIQDKDEPTVGDFSLLQALGANAVRIYHHASDDPLVQEGYGSKGQHLQYNHPPNKDLMRDLYNTYGIRTIMGDFIGAYTIGTGASWAEGTDYLNPVHRQRIRNSVRQMVLDFKDEPFLLFYVLGNENNYDFTRTNAYLYPVEYSQFVEELVQMIHEMDPHHPVSLCHGETRFIDTLAQHAPSVDIFGANIYRGSGFGTLWQQVQTAYNKPVFLTEYGNLREQFIGEELDQEHQSSVHQACWLDIQNNLYGSGYGNAIGGTAYAWLDKWWANGRPREHNRAPTGANHEEYKGITAQGNGALSPYIRQIRLVYGTYQSLWTGRGPGGSPGGSSRENEIFSREALPSADKGYGYSFRLTVPQGTAPFSWTVASGKLAPGLLLSSEGFLTGIPSEAGHYDFDLDVVDANRNLQSKKVSLVVNPINSQDEPTGFKAPPAGELEIRVLQSVYVPEENPAALIHFENVPTAAHLTILSMDGRVVLDREVSSADFQWDGTDGSGRLMPSGAYIARFKSAQGIQEKKIVVVR